MKVKTSRETVTELIRLLERYEPETEKFLDNLPTPEKYAILSMYLVIHGGYDDYEVAYDEATHSVTAQDLTKHLMRIRFLNHHLEDALRLKWDYFETVWTNDDPDDEDIK